MDFTKLTIKHFISDLPRIFNKNFDTIKAFIDKVFTEKSNSIAIGSEDLNLTGKFTLIEADEIKSGNIIISENGKWISLEEYIQEKVDSAIEEHLIES